jgi:Tol biopolymer transport system component
VTVSAQAHPVATTPATETALNPSPDGSMVAYVSDETGSNELYDFDVALDRRIIVTEDVHGLFDLVLVRNGMNDLVKGTKK